LKYLKQSTPKDNLQSNNEIKKIIRKWQAKQFNKTEDNLNCQPDNSVTIEVYKKGAKEDPTYYSCLDEKVNQTELSRLGMALLFIKVDMDFWPKSIME
jgi:hypothetical protein